ncbi:MAG: methyltransferase [Gammaproteobacteria bacterium 39-13]|nr:MgtC/SapB family protein [Gammaproteobacteria bacterium]OJV96501.1 MAG: methyltransferase [Gammaproteobacteria bacterium 39-13]
MLSTIDIIIRLLTAAFLGSIIGFERERLLWAAGLRTHMLVCVGSCLIMIVSAFGFADVLSMKNVMLDPSRIAAQVVSGIGFLGAGVILFRGEVIRGLTTAASVWTVAGIGLAVGGGLYIAAFCATIIILIILVGIKPLEKKFKKNTYAVLLKVKKGGMTLSQIQKAIGSRSAYIKQFIIQPDESSEYEKVDILLERISKKASLEITETLRKMPSVIEIIEK